MKPVYIKTISEDVSVRSVYSKVNSRKILQVLISDIEDQFKQNPFNEITYTIRLNQLEGEMGIRKWKAYSTVRRFLELEGKRYHPKDTRRGGRRYLITVKREELNRWKTDALNF